MPDFARVVEAIFTSEMEDVISAVSQCSPQHACTKMRGAPSVGNNTLTPRLHTIDRWSPSLYCHPHALPSLDSLDLVSDTSVSTSQQTHAQFLKRPFRIQIPRLHFGKCKSITDLKTPGDVAAPSSVGVTSPPVGGIC